MAAFTMTLEIKKLTRTKYLSSYKNSQHQNTWTLTRFCVTPWFSTL